MTSEQKQCCKCNEAQQFSGASIFYICRITKQYRSTADSCNLNKVPKK